MFLYCGHWGNAFLTTSDSICRSLIVVPLFWVMCGTVSDRFPLFLFSPDRSSLHLVCRLVRDYCPSSYHFFIWIELKLDASWFTLLIHFITFFAAAQPYLHTYQTYLSCLSLIRPIKDAFLVHGCRRPLGAWRDWAL